MTTGATKFGQWLGFALAVLALSAVLAALVVYWMNGLPGTGPAGVGPFQWLLYWQATTLALALILGLSVWRMIRYERHAGIAFSPWHALALLTATLALIAAVVAAATYFSLAGGVLEILLVVAAVLPTLLYWLWRGRCAKDVPRDPEPQ